MNMTLPGCSASTNSGSWLTITIVPGHSASARATPLRDGGSRLLVGSSRSSRLCRPATSWASASFVFSPPDRVPASGGEKTKLALAQLVAGRHNLLLLDEPTNNLDPPSRDAVADALSAWPGSMVVVSHDRDFVEALEPDQVVMMPEGAVDFWSEYYLDLVSLA